jgi:hypothetical protein
MKKDRNTKAEPGFVKRRNRISGQFRAHLIEMIESPAWRALSLSARRVIDRIEIELAHHGGNDNSRLPVTKRNFIDYGIPGRLVAPATREAEALGFIRVTKRGRGGNAEHRQSNLFFLTFTHCRSSRDEPPTHDWRKIKTIEEAEAIAAAARGARDANAVAFGRRSWRLRKNRNRYHKVVPAPVPQSGPETVNSPVPQSGPTGLGLKVVPLSISRGGWWGHGRVSSKTESRPQTLAMGTAERAPAWETAAACAAADAYVPPSALDPAAVTASPLPWVSYSERDIDHDRHSPEGLMAHVADVIETQLSNLEEAREAKQGMSATNGDDAHRRRSISANKAHRLFRQHMKHEKAWGQAPADMSLRCRINELGVPRERVEIEFRRIKRLAEKLPPDRRASTRPHGAISFDDFK